jgi:diadenosine tetraphosphate (Ap4A) HIT family hydrolase
VGPAGCLACDLAAGRVPLPGGLIHGTSAWRVEHCVGPLGVGTLLVKPTRHVVHVADLDAVETVEMGPLLQRTAEVVTRLVRPEQVYVCLWSHADRTPGHLHYVVQPARTEDLDATGTYGPALQTAMFARGETPPSAEVEAFAQAARPLFADP